MMCSSWMVMWYKLGHPHRLTLSTTGAAMSTMVCTQAMPPVAPPKHPSAAAPVAPVVQTQARIEVLECHDSAFLRGFRADSGPPSSPEKGLFGP